MAPGYRVNEQMERRIRVVNGPVFSNPTGIVNPRHTGANIGIGSAV
jgi:hypothetical protein